MQQPQREHPELGLVRWDEELQWWEAEADLREGQRLRLTLEPESEEAFANPAELFNRGEEFLRWAREEVAQCKERVADDLLDLYNSAWADEDPEEGTPPMDRAAFLDNVKLASIKLSEDGSADWMFEAGDLFAGHGISVWMNTERVFRQANLFG